MTCHRAAPRVKPADPGSRRSCRLLEHVADRAWQVVEIDGEDYVSTGEAAAALAHVGVTTAMVRAWARRGQLAPVTRLDGRPVYRLRDVRAVERATRDRGRARRAAGR